MKSVTLSLLQSAANAFDFGGPVLCDAHHYGEGHINDTFVVWREDHSKRFILQRINTDTFTNPVGLMENVCGVTRHLRAKILAPLGQLLVGACLPQTLLGTSTANRKIYFVCKSSRKKIPSVRLTNISLSLIT